jgi:hypothetical protein
MRDFSDGAGDLVELEERRMKAISLWQQGETQAAVARWLQAEIGSEAA